MIVVDASVLVGMLANIDAEGELARNVVRQAREVAAPDLVNVETVAALRKHWLSGRLTTQRFDAAVDDLLDLPVLHYPAAPFVRRVFELRDNVTPYDAAYVALAEGLGCPLVTRDRRLANATGPACEISLIGSQ